MTMIGGERGDVDQDVLDDGDRGRRAQPARIGEGRQDDERDDQRQVADEAGARDAERADHHLEPDELQRDVGHGRDDAGDRHRQRQPAVAEAAAHEIGGGDVVVLVADVPEPREHQEQDRIDDDRVRHGEERDGAGAEGQRRNGDESVGGVEVAADQEPGDDRAEAPAAEAPFVQQVEIALAPVGGREAEPGDEAEQQHEDDQRGPVDVLHGSLPDFPLFRSADREASRLVLGREIDDRGEHGADDHPKQLIPVEERHADPGRLDLVVEGRPEHRDELDDEEQVPPAPSRPPLALLIYLLPPTSPFAGTSPEASALPILPDAPVFLARCCDLGAGMGIEPTT